MFWRRVVWLALIVLATFVGAFCSWVLGFMILPQMGLRAPGYWDWFGFAVVGAGVAFIRGMFKGAFKELNAWGEHDGE